MQGGFIDASLFGVKEKIACGISIGKAKEYELKNIVKCIDAGFDHVLLVSQNTKSRNALKRHIEEKAQLEVLALLHFYSSDSFLAFLDKRGAANAATEKMVRG